MKVLLCLLSGQHVPNLLAVHHFRPDRIVLIETVGMRKLNAAAHFKSALCLGGLDDLSASCHVEPLTSEDNLDDVRQCLQRAYGRYPTGGWTVNLTGGTKPMSIAAYEFFKALGARLIYVNLNRPGEMLALDGRATESCSYRPTLREFLAGYGFESTKSSDSIAEAEARAEQWWNCALEIAKRPTDQSLLQLGNLSDATVKKRWDTARNKGLQLEPGFLAPKSSVVRAGLSNVFSLSETGDCLSGKLDKYGVEFVTGGWLEVFVWGLMRRHENALGIWDVRLGIHPAKIGATIDSDLDVAFMHSHQLWMVECKSGAQTHDPGAEILHKVEAVVRQFRALGIRSCLATTSPNVLAKDGTLRPSIKDRASIYQCRVIVGDAIQKLAESPEDADLVRELVLCREG